MYMINYIRGSYHPGPREQESLHCLVGNSKELLRKVEDDGSIDKTTDEELRRANLIKGYGTDETSFGEWLAGNWDKLRGESKLFDSIFLSVEDKTFMDIGCGYGSMLFAYLIFKGLEPMRRIVLDLDPVALNSPHHRDGREKINASFTDIPLADSSVDFVYSSFTTMGHHKIDREKFEECRRILKPNGFYIAGYNDGYNHDFGSIGFKKVELGECLFGPIVALYLPC